MNPQISEFILKQVVFDVIKTVLENIIMPFLLNFVVDPLLKVFDDNSYLKQAKKYLSQKNLKINRVLHDILYYSMIFIIISYVI